MTPGLRPSTRGKGLGLEAFRDPQKRAFKVRVEGLGFKVPRPSIYPLLEPKCPLFGTIYPYLRVQGGSWFRVLGSGVYQEPQAPFYRVRIRPFIVGIWDILEGRWGV